MLIHFQGTESHFIFVFNTDSRKQFKRYIDEDHDKRIHGLDLALNPQQKENWPCRQALKRHALAAVLKNLCGAAGPIDLDVEEDDDDEEFESTVKTERVHEWLQKTPIGIPPPEDTSENVPPYNV